MAPGLNGCQSGNVPKNKSKTKSRPVREVLALAENQPWELRPDQERRRTPSSIHSETDPTSLRPRRVTASSRNLVDNDNGELSWGLSLLLGDSPGPPPRSQRPIGMSSDQPSGSSPMNGAGGSGRNNPPNRYQVVNKLASIQDYIEQTEAVMRELRASDTPGCKEQHDKLVEMLADLRDSESKLKVLLRGMDQVDAKIDKLLNGVPQPSHMNGDGPTEEEIHRKTDEHNRKIDALEKQRQELLELQQLAQRKLAEAEAERARLLTRATSYNTDAIAGTSLEANLHSLTERLRNVERVCDDQNRLSAAMDRSVPAEHPDEDQAEGELSDTETDYQLVRDKVAELNAMKAQLAQLQNMMAAIETEHDGSEDGSRRSQSRDMQKVERVVGQIQELNRLVESVRNQGIEDDEPESRQQLASLTEPRMSEDVSVEAMQQLTRDLEEQTARMKSERDRLLQARSDLQNMARLARGRASSSADDSESEPPSLLPANVSSTPRNVEEDSASRSGGRKSNDGGGFRAPPRVRQRAVWNQSLPTLVNVNQESLERRRKEPRSSQSSVRNGEGGGARARTEASDWSPDLVNTEAVYQTQSQLEESAQLCEQLLQDSEGPSQVPTGAAGGNISGIFYSQLQNLSRNVSQCCRLLWLQQRQINELRNAMMLQQSAAVPTQMHMNQQPGPSQSGSFACVHPSLFPQAPTRVFPASVPPEKPYEAPTGFYGDVLTGNRPLPSQNPISQNFDPLQDFRYRSRDFNPIMFASRPGDQDMRVPPNNQGPQMPPAMACFSPDEMGPPGALNNQVPPGNRANNYWDNFRSYSRQNLLSTSKSNENSDPLRRAGTARQLANQERTPHAIVPPNNQSQNPVGEVQPLRHTQAAASATPMPHSSNHIARSRSAEPQTLRNIGGVKNRTCEVAARREDGDVMRPRNNTGAGPRNSGVLRPWDGAGDRANPDDSLTRVRNNTGGARSRIRADLWGDGPSTREEPDESLNRLRNNTGGGRNRIELEPWEGVGIRRDAEESLNRVRNNTGLGARNQVRVGTWATAGVRETLEDRVRNNTGSGARNRTGPDPCDLPPDQAELANNRTQAWNLNNRTDANNPFAVLRLPTSVYQEVTSFIRANEARPNFLIQLFRDLQQVTSDPQRQRALQSLQEVVGPNNIVLEARNNMLHNNRSNLNRYADEAAVDQLFDQLRDNQNTIRQNIGNIPHDTAGNNLENPNISNIRDIPTSATLNPNPNPVNNLDEMELRDFHMFFEGLISNAGPGSSLKNPNLSNIRENLAEGSLSDYERMNPKNVYLSLYESLVEDLRRRGIEADYVPSFERENVRPMNFDEEFFVVENRPARFDMMERREMGDRPGSFPDCDGFGEEPRALDGTTGGAVRKRGLHFSDAVEERGQELRDDGPILRSPEWHPAENPFTMFVRPMSQLGPYQEQAILQTDDADLAEADQTRSVEGSESLSVYLNRLTSEVECELPEELQPEESPAEDNQTVTVAEPREGEVAHPLEADPNENLVPHERNNNKPSTAVKNRMDGSGEGGVVKVTKTRLQEAFAASTDAERPPSESGDRPHDPPMMDMAGALEHLIDYRRPREESSPYHRSDGFQEAEVEAEREAGLDQVPTRLEKRDSLGAERDEPA